MAAWIRKFFHNELLKDLITESYIFRKPTHLNEVKQFPFRSKIVWQCVYYLERLLEKVKESFVPSVICLFSASDGSLTSDSLSDDTGIGYAICLIDIYMGMYYNTIIGWAVYYLFASFDSELPWMTCNNPWNTRDCAPVLSTRTNTSTSPAKEFFE